MFKQIGAVVVMSGGLACGAAAEITADFVEVDASRIVDGVPYSVWEMQVDVTGSDDWVTARLKIDLTEGTLYQYTGAGTGGVKATNPAFWELIPALGSDTFVQAPGLDLTDFVLGEGAESAVSFDATWGDNSVLGAGVWTIAQIVLSQDAAGTISGRVTSDQGNNIVQIPSGMRISGGNIVPVPEPASVALLAVGGLAMLRRRR